MPVIQRKRRAPAVQDEDDSDNDTSRTTSFNDSTTRRQTNNPQPSTQRRRRSRSASSASSASLPEDLADSTAPGSTKRHPALDTTSPAHAALVKSLVRLALATSYTRTPLRRTDITTKIFQPASAPPKAFRTVFDEAQLALRRTFGVELVELPGRERATGGIAARRAAATQAASAATKASAQKEAQLQDGGTSTGAGTGGTAASNKAWALVTILPAEFRGPEILPPSHNPTPALDAAYTGLVTFIVSLIALSGGSVAEGKLERYLKRVNAESSTPVDRTDKLLARMIKEGYIDKVKEGGGAGGGEVEVEYIIGPRGKVEVGADGVKGLVRGVYKDTEGDTAESQEAGEDDLEKKLERSLKVGLSSSAFGAARTTNGARTQTAAAGADREDEGAVPTVTGQRKRGRPRKSAQRQETDEEESEE